MDANTQKVANLSKTGDVNAKESTIGDVKKTVKTLSPMTLFYALTSDDDANNDIICCVTKTARVRH